MKQLPVLAALVLLSATPAFSQAPQLNWDEVYYTGQGTNTGKRVLVGEDDDVYVLGQDGTGNAYLARYQSFNGQPQWTVQWDSTSTAVDLVRGTDGTLYATWEHYNQPVNSPVDIGVGAWSSEGQPLWTFAWNDSLDRDDLVRDLHLDPDGNLLLCATTEELSGNPSVFNNISVLKLDPTGELLWRRTWNGSINNDDEPNAITCAPDGSIYVAGSTRNAGINGVDLLLLKYSPEGVLQWDVSLNRNTGVGSARWTWAHMCWCMPMATSSWRASPKAQAMATEATSASTPSTPRGAFPGPTTTTTRTITSCWTWSRGPMATSTSWAAPTSSPATARWWCA